MSKRGLKHPAFSPKSKILTICRKAAKRGFKYLAFICLFARYILSLPNKYTKTLYK